MTEITKVPTAQIVPGDNDRKTFDQDALRELAQSIALHGLAQPITVRPIDDEVYQIVAGERRFRACSQILGWTEIPAIVRTDLDDEAASAIMLAENTGRADLNPIEEAMAYEARAARFGWTDAHIAEIAGVSEGLVSRRRSLLSLVPEAQHLVAVGQMPIGHAEALVKLDVNRQRIALRIYGHADNMPLRMFRRVCNDLYEEQAQETLWDVENFWLQQVVEQEETPRRGKKAVTFAPTRKDLPPVDIWDDCHTNEVIDAYIAKLIEAGHKREAAAIGNLYDALVHSNFLSVPEQSRLRAC